MKLTSHKSGQIIVPQLEIAERFFERFRGLIGRSEISIDTALLIRRCKIVHTFFLAFPIDLVFCAENGTIVLLQENLRPWRISKIAPLASYVIEFQDGAIREKRICLGDQLQISS